MTGEQQRRATAYHEAGHAVMAHCMDIPLVRVSVEKDASDGSQGYTKGRMPRWFDPGNPHDKRIPDLYQRCILMSLAGVEAEKMVRQRANHVGAKEDYRNAQTLAGEMIHTDEEGKALLKWLTIRCREIINSPRFRILLPAVAEALLQHNALSSKQLKQTIAAAMDAEVRRQQAERGKVLVKTATGWASETFKAKTETAGVEKDRYLTL